MNYETICNPVSGAEVDGFNFSRDQNGNIVARCCWCMVGFDVTAENAATIRPMMIMHLEFVHIRPRPDPQRPTVPPMQSAQNTSKIPGS